MRPAPVRRGFERTGFHALHLLTNHALVDITLHLGAHKTASTYLQSVLASSLDRLRAAGVDYVTLQEMREKVTPRVARMGLNLKPAVKELLEDHAGYRRLILSDENLPGGSREIIERTYYPAAGKRVGRLIRALAGHRVQIVLAMRSYEAFISSMYCECIRHGAFLTPAAYLSQLDAERVSWPALLAQLSALVGEDAITLWRFEDFAAIENDVLAAMAGGIRIEWAKPDTVVRRSFSQKAVDALVALEPVLSGEEIRMLVEPVSDALPKSRSSPAFRAHDEKAAAALKKRYDQDIARIQRDFPAVNWITPTSMLSRFTQDGRSRPSPPHE